MANQWLMRLCNACLPVLAAVALASCGGSASSSLTFDDTLNATKANYANVKVIAQGGQGGSAGHAGTTDRKLGRALGGVVGDRGRGGS